MRIIRMKKNILASAALLALAACTTDSNDDYKCNVSRTGNSVTLSESYKGESYLESRTVYQDEYGYYYSYVNTVYTMGSAAAAAEVCDDEKMEARHWKDGSYGVECYGNTVSVTQYDDGGLSSLDEAAYEYQSICDDGFRREKNGTLDDDF